MATTEAPIEVDATVAAPRESYQGDLPILDLSKLDRDVNNDGKVSWSEKIVRNRLEEANTSGTGVLTVSELYKFFESLTKVERDRRLFKLIVVFVVGALIVAIIVQVLGLLQPCRAGPAYRARPIRWRPVPAAEVEQGAVQQTALQTLSRCSTVEREVVIKVIDRNAIKPWWRAKKNIIHPLTWQVR